MPRWCDAELSNFLVILFWIRFLAHRSQERLVRLRPRSKAPAFEALDTDVWKQSNSPVMKK